MNRKRVGMKARHSIKLFALLAPIVCSLALMSVVWANGSPVMWVPPSSGLVVPPSSTDVKVQRCQLSIAFNSQTSAQVQTTYTLINAADKAVEADLLFIALSTDDLKLSVDGQPTQLTPSDEKLPQSWLNPVRLVDPRTNQLYDLEEHYARPRGDNRGWSFHVRLPANGQTAVTADYSSMLGADPSKGYYQTHHLAYVLGSAAQWVGPLEVAVSTPARYSLGSSPAVGQQSGTGDKKEYRASFEKVPTEMLVLSTQAIPDAASDFIVENLTTIGLLSPLVPALLVGVVVGVAFSRLRRPWLAFILAGVVGLILAFVASAVVSVTVSDNETLKRVFDELLDSMVVGYNAVSMLSGFVLAPLLGAGVACVWATIGSLRRRNPQVKQ